MAGSTAAVLVLVLVRNRTRPVAAAGLEYTLDTVPAVEYETGYADRAAVAANTIAARSWTAVGHIDPGHADHAAPVEADMIAAGRRLIGLAVDCTDFGCADLVAQMLGTIADHSLFGAAGHIGYEVYLDGLAYRRTHPAGHTVAVLVFVQVVVDID